MFLISLLYQDSHAIITIQYLNSLPTNMIQYGQNNYLSFGIAIFHSPLAITYVFVITKPDKLPIKAPIPAPIPAAIDVIINPANASEGVLQ